MKLADHVQQLRQLIEASFDKTLARLGIGKTQSLDLEKLPDSLQSQRLRLDQLLENHTGEVGSYESARAKLLDELTFTLFNRLAAIKVMEAARLFPPILTKQAEHGDRSFGHLAWLELNPDMRSAELEGIDVYLQSEFDKLGRGLSLYGRDYAFGWLPDVISLNVIIEAFNGIEKDPQVGSEIWLSDDVLGWLYESYNVEKKKALKESKAKIEFDKVSLQSQVYTPRWVVQFLVENSLGKLYLEMFPNSPIRERFKIANAPTVREREPKPLTEIKVIDPACGSGNFLLYAFDFFYELYLDQINTYGTDYEEREIPGLILTHNLHGVDLDDRAVQLAQLGLFIKARRRCRSLSSVRFRVVSSDFFLPDYGTVREIFEAGGNLDGDQRQLIQSIWGDLRNAYRFGSLIRLDEKLNSRIQVFQQQIAAGDNPLFASAFLEEEKDFAAVFFANLRRAVAQYAQAGGNAFLSDKTADAITFLEVLTRRYDVALANPPYTDSSDFGTELKGFIDDNYKKPEKFNTNLYATFIKRCYELTEARGFISMLHPLTFMYIKTFEDVRKFILNNTNINLLAELGLGGVFANSDVQVDVAMYVLEKTNKLCDGIYFDLKEYKNHTSKPKIFYTIYNNLFESNQDQHIFRIPQSKLKIIKSWPFIYWISDEFRAKFKSGLLEKNADIRAGIQTSNNNRFLRFWWEISPQNILLENDLVDSNKRWIRYSKGGPYQKWFGNIWLTIDWEEQGKSLQSFLISKGQDLHAQEYYYREGLTYSAAGSKGISLRYLPSNHLFDIGGSSIFLIKDFNNIFYLMGLLNSKLSFYIADCLNPTVNKQPGDLKRIPFVIPNKLIEIKVGELSKICYLIKKYLCQYCLVEFNFHLSPYIKSKKLKDYFSYENHLLTQVLINEAIINEKIFEVYDLTEHDKAIVLAKEGESIGGLPVDPKARTAYLAETDATQEFPLDHIREFIETLPSKEFSPIERAEIEKGFPTLYQSNNDLEEFCIRHQVNPINVWYWFKQSNVIPQQRAHTLAMEFLADLIREILMEDEDGIIPLVSNAGEKILLDRIEEKFREKGFTQAQYSSFDNLLGKPLPDYLNKNFFAELSDHLKLFKQLPATPFIWHLSSGAEQGFDCYIIIYKWSRDKLQLLRSVYLENRERALINRQTDLTNNDSADAQTEKDRIFKQLQEIAQFKTKIDELLQAGYNPILDDGVGKNIAPLQEKKMIPYEVLNPGQLKKYLNADW